MLRLVLDTAKRTALSKCTNMNKQPAMQQGGRAEQNSRLYLVTQTELYEKKFKICLILNREKEIVKQC